MVVKATTWFFSCMFYVVLLLLLFFSESSYSTLMLYSTNIAKQQKQRRVSKYEVMNLAVAVRRRGLLFLLTLTSFSKFVFVEYEVVRASIFIVTDYVCRWYLTMKLYSMKNKFFEEDNHERWQLKKHRNLFSRTVWFKCRLWHHM